MPGHRAGDGIIERRPAAAGLELLLGRVEGGVAGGAVVGALGGRVLVVLAGEGRLGAFLANDAELSWGGLSVAKSQCVEHGDVPGLSWACHSLSLFWSGYDMVCLDEEDENRDPKRGMLGIDLRAVGLRAGRSGAGAARNVVLLSAKSVRMKLLKTGRRIDIVIVGV